MILAAKSLLKSPLQGTAVFAFVAEEETGGKGIKEVLPMFGSLDGAVVGEPTKLEVCTAQRGMVLLRCMARGVAAHAGHAQLGENAIHKASRDIQRLASMEFEPHPLLGTTRPQVTLVSGGNVHNQIPDFCEFSVDVRTTPNLSNDDFVNRIAGELESEVTVTSLRYQPKATDPQEPIVQAALKAAGATSGVGSFTCSDWAFLGDIPAVKAGPGDTHRSHRPNEWLSIPELQAGGAFYTALVQEFFRLKAAHV
jgi:acetylornithine deacetylase